MEEEDNRVYALEVTIKATLMIAIGMSTIIIFWTWMWGLIGAIVAVGVGMFFLIFFIVLALCENTWALCEMKDTLKENTERMDKRVHWDKSGEEDSYCGIEGLMTRWWGEVTCEDCLLKYIKER